MVEEVLRVKRELNDLKKYLWNYKKQILYNYNIFIINDGQVHKRSSSHWLIILDSYPFIRRFWWN